jgi:hypothetical protein
LSFDSEFQRPDSFPAYRDDLAGYLRELTIGYKFFLEEKAKLHYDEELFTECIAYMVVITSHLLPKLEGGGSKTERLYNELKVYEPWIDDIMIPKLKERSKVNDLYKIILRCYDILGLTPLG